MVMKKKGEVKSIMMFFEIIQVFSTYSSRLQRQIIALTPYISSQTLPDFYVQP